MHVFVVIVVLEVGHTVLVLQLAVALPVLVAGVGTSLTTGHEIGHSVQVWGLFSLVRRKAPVFSGSGAHGRHARFDTFWFLVFFFFPFTTPAGVVLRRSREHGQELDVQLPLFDRWGFCDN